MAQHLFLSKFPINETLGVAKPLIKYSDDLDFKELFFWVLSMLSRYFHK